MATKARSIKLQATRLVVTSTKTGEKHGSIRSANHRIAGLTRIGNWCKEAYGIKKLDQITSKMAQEYLYERAEVVTQSTLDQERQSLETLASREKSKLYNAKIPRIKSSVHVILKSKRYTEYQIKEIISSQSAANGLATRIARASGVRAHEMHTLRRIAERSPDDRIWNSNLYIGKENWISYTVTGKGGLTREIRLPKHIADELEQQRLDTPKRITDRGVHYHSYYDINGGQNWSSSFSKASKRALGWSNGAHGTRHSYVQNRVVELQNLGYNINDAKLITSQEIGHHRPDIIDVYLR